MSSNPPMSFQSFKHNRDNIHSYLIVFKAHMNILFILKVKILKFIKWSYNPSSITVCWLLSSWWLWTYHTFLVEWQCGQHFLQLLEQHKWLRTKSLDPNEHEEDQVFVSPLEFDYLSVIEFCSTTQGLGAHLFSLLDVNWSKIKIVIISNNNNIINLFRSLNSFRHMCFWYPFFKSHI